MPTVKDRTIIISDIHVPYNNKKATKTALEYIKQEKPRYLVINGDAIDFYSISRYSRDPHRRLALQDELLGFSAFLDDVDDAAPEAEKIFVLGNHEIRWIKYLREHAVEFEGVRQFKLSEILEFGKRGIHVAPAGFKFSDSCYIIHGDGLFGSRAGQTATKWVDRYMASCVVGHIHRLAIVHRRTAAKDRLFGVEAGTLSLLDPMYEMTSYADWQTGFCSLTRYTSGVIVPSIHEIIGNNVYSS